MAQVTLAQYDNAVDSINRAWCWWTAELRSLVPSRIADYFRKEKYELILCASNEMVSLELRKDGGISASRQVALDGESEFELRQTAADLVNSCKTVPSISVVIPPDSLLERTIYLPLAVEHNLDNLLHFEIDKFTPYSSDNVCFVYHISKRIPEQDKLMIELTAISKESLVRLVDRFKPLGLPISAVYSDSSKGSAEAGAVNLMPTAMRAEAASAWDAEARRAAKISIALAFLLFLFPAIYLEYTSRANSDELEELRSQATEIAAKRSNARSQIEAKRSIVSRSATHHGKLDLILTLTQLLPDNTWASTVRIANGNISMGGESGKASDLIELLEQSEHFENVKFRSPVTVNTSTGMERYEIEMDLAGAES